jgi:hypothetical protein
VKDLRTKTLSAYSAAMIVLVVVMASAAYAQQQQYANAYAFWQFGEKANDIENVDQTVWIVKPANGTQWVMTWAWVADPAHGGYLGFNTGDDGKSQALFSLWNADQAKGQNCKTFGGEGEGWSCRMPIEISADKYYRFRLARASVEKLGVWWGAWITEGVDSDSAKEHYLGEIRVNSKMSEIRGNSINDFSEYYGHTVKKCSEVPASIFAVAPPAANRNKATNEYARNSTFQSGSNPADNPCKNGTESSGNLFKVDGYDFGYGAGAVIFLGGTAADHVMPSDNDGSN